MTNPSPECDRRSTEKGAREALERDIDKNPYSPDEQRVAQWFFDKGTGGGNDPIGSLIASHELLAAERNELRAALTPVVAREPMGWRVDGTQNGKPAVFFYWKPEWPKMRAEQGDKVTPLYTSPPPASAVREATIEECAKWHEHRAELETNSLHCGDNSGTISAAHRVAAFHRFSARELRTLIKGTADESTKTIGIRD